MSDRIGEPRTLAAVLGGGALHEVPCDAQCGATALSLWRDKPALCDECYTTWQHHLDRRVARENYEASEAWRSVRAALDVSAAAARKTCDEIRDARLRNETSERLERLISWREAKQPRIRTRSEW